MKIETLKDLKQLIALCRKTGVAYISTDGISLQLSETTKKQASTKRQLTDFSSDFPEANVKVPQYDPFLAAKQAEQSKREETQELTEEQLLFYSSSSSESIS